MQNGETLEIIPLFGNRARINIYKGMLLDELW